MSQPLVPWIIYKPIYWLVIFLEWFIGKITPPPQAVMRKTTSAVDSYVIWMCCRLGISEILGKKSLQTEALAHQLGLPHKSLVRLLRAAKQCGFFNLKTDSMDSVWVQNNRWSEILHADHPDSMKPLIQNLEREFRCFEHLEYSLRTVEDSQQPSAFLKQYGKEMWEWLDDNPKQQRGFSAGMKVRDNLGVKALVHGYAWRKHSRILDIGGASGSFLAEILRGPARTSQGVVCDLAPVIDHTTEFWESDQNLAAIKSRVSFAPIDFFKPGSLPVARDGDCFLMRDILHDWSDVKSIEILQNVRSSMQSFECTLAIVEMSYIDEAVSPVSAASTRADLIMMTNLKGKERTRSEWKSLFAATGFKLIKFIPTRSPYFITLAKPVPQSI